MTSEKRGRILSCLKNNYLTSFVLLMALSSILQFDCSIDNEIAQNATKNFAGFLVKAFEEHKKLWNEYLKLRKYCEDADFNIPFQVLESDIYNNNDVIASDTSQVSSGNIDTFTSSHNSISPNYNSDIPYVENIFLTNKSIEKKTQEDMLLKSPILIKKHFRCKRTNRNILFEKLKKSKCPISKNYYEEIECTPVGKMGKRLKVSTLHNINNILVQNNKRQLQSMPPLDKQSTDSTTDKKYKDFDFLKPCISNIVKKNIEGRSKSHNKSIEEEIIESSPPSKYITSSLKIKNIKRKNKTQNKVSTEINQISLNPFMSPVHTSTQKKKSLLITGLETHNFLEENTKNDCNSLSSALPLALVNTEHLYLKDIRNLSTSINKVKKIKLEEDTISAEGKKYLESSRQLLDINSSTFNDETFCLFGEELKEKSTPDTNKSEDIKQNISENKMLPKYLSVKKCLLSSFDVPQDTKVHIDKPSKKRSERAKVTGSSCSECERYYANLGLTEQEIQARQDKCSRHRLNYNKRESTPEGFWDPIFADPYTSTLQD